MRTVPFASLIPAATAARCDTSALGAFMDFYACDDGDDQDESEVELMVQLSGMVAGQTEWPGSR